MTKCVAGWLREPIAQSLLISLALHLAIAVLFQPAPGSSVRHTVVINARLQAASPAVAAEAAVAAQSHPPETLLSATTPSPAPPIPQLPAPVRESAAAPNIPPTQSHPAPAMPVPVAATATTDMPSSAAQSTEPTRGGPLISGLPSLPISIDTTWYSARQVDIHPKSMGEIEPVYPEQAKEKDLEGTLRLMLKIDDLGRVQSVEVVEATPPGVFDEAALAAVRAARFHPAMKGGRPVRYQGYLRMGFKLKD